MTIPMTIALRELAAETDDEYVAAALLHAAAPDLALALCSLASEALERRAAR
jgi:hypothetical protein